MTQSSFTLIVLLAFMVLQYANSFEDIGHDCFPIIVYLFKGIFLITIIFYLKKKKFPKTPQNISTSAVNTGTYTPTHSRSAKSNRSLNFRFIFQCSMFPAQPSPSLFSLQFLQNLILPDCMPLFLERPSFQLYLLKPYPTHKETALFLMLEGSKLPLPPGVLPRL